MHIDKELIQRCLKEDRKAQFELYRECYGPMMSVCLRYHNSDLDAMHTLNQAFLSVCTKLNQYREEVVFESWVKRITINACIDEYRKNKKRIENTQGFDESALNGISIGSDLNQGALALDAESLRAIIRLLPEMSQQVFNLVVIDGYPYEEVAELLGISETTCRWHVHHARKKLQALIRSEDLEMKNIAS